jgi:hypothetical protein
LYFNFFFELYTLFQFGTLVDKLAAEGHLTSQLVGSVKTSVDVNLQWLTTYGADISEYLEDFIKRSEGSGMNLVASTALLALTSAFLIIKSIWM